MTAAPLTTELVTVPLERLIANRDYQPRAAGLSEVHVRLLMETGAETFPPILISARDDGAFNVLDGFHRLEAARRLGVTVLPCVVSDGGGYPEAVAANIRHGLPLSISDRKEAARWWADHEPDLSFREIGRRSGLSDKTCKRAIEADTDTSSGASPRTAPDPIERLVTLAYQTYTDHHGRKRFGFGDGDPKAFRREIETYPEDDRPAVARALTAFGQAVLEASRPYTNGKRN